ncbi:MAG: hypothetical protein ABH806_03665 [Candidatus Omnitrophota bacterium]
MVMAGKEEGLMKGIAVACVLLLILFCISIYPGYSQEPYVSMEADAMRFDVNKDGEPDVTYHRGGIYVAKVEADTNYDARPDVIVHLKEGKFESAEVDTDYDGKTDRKYVNMAAFNNWLNENKPDFSDKLNRADWQFDMIKF